jgi:MarR-like DNA-binding transcriptional regulator SgrR of sgrS sRNA
MKMQRLVRQYRRLLVRWKTSPVDVTLADISDTLSCSPRYARTLLQVMSHSGWLIWSTQPGRGALGNLQCIMNEDALLSLVEENEAKSQVCFIEGKGITTEPEQPAYLQIPFSRPLSLITPSVHISLAERHLVRMVHAGLTRLQESGKPMPDLSHTVECLNNGKLWHFHIQPGLVWHNGETVEPEQLLNALRLQIRLPALSHIIAVELVGQTCIVFQLSRPDWFLAHRLANQAFAFAHPKHKECGLGPFRITQHSNDVLTLVRSEYYHGKKPALSGLEYCISNQSYEYQTQLRLIKGKSTVYDINHEQAETNGFMFLTFNANRNGLGNSQQALIRYLADQAVIELKNEDDDIHTTPQNWTRESKPLSDADTKLPAFLSISYFLTPRSTRLLTKLQKSLKLRGCQLFINSIGPDRWFLQESWEDQDMGLSFIQPGESHWFSLEERFHDSIMIQTFLSESLRLRLSQIFSRAAMTCKGYDRNIHRVMHVLFDKQIIHPLFGYRFRIRSSRSIKGVHFTKEGWPDFTHLWIDESVEAHLPGGDAVSVAINPNKQITQNSSSETFPPKVDSSAYLFSDESLNVNDVCHV